MQSFVSLLSAGRGLLTLIGPREKLVAMQQQLDFSVKAIASAEPEEQERLDIHKAAMIVISLSLALWVEIALLAHWFFW